MIIIIGAGIAGLTLANYLQRSGKLYVVLEAAEKLTEVGAGILLQNNSLAILRQLSLEHLLDGELIDHMAMGYHSAHGTVNIKQLGMEAVCVHRAVLQSALLANIPDTHIKLSSVITHVEIQAHGVTVKLANGETISGAYAVNCAGINSDLHAKPIITSTQLWCWRAIVSLNEPINTFREHWFDEQRIGFGPISQTQAYLFHVVDERTINSAHYSDKQRQAWILSKIPEVPDLSAINFAETVWLSHPLQERDINWGHGRFIAIGDAAHAMTPNLGQGAAIAMEDGAVLAQLFIENPADVLASLVKKRDKRVANMKLKSLYVGKVAHSQQPVMRALKWITFRYLPFKPALKSQLTWINAFVHSIKGN
ncbi:FAD-dependent monooxygenase [Reinekea sp.]|jgi:2-polyprenyl-6-methoxyphenol hydroxylase-like FAD-dependent oxidoreductase|uniref:FAD-dependent monooxygenase n=1 Tax=Reinekea sp. TaxID=1970455 RepID=UPI00398A0012